MKYLILLLLIAGAAGPAATQPDSPDAAVKPSARPPRPEQPATLPTPAPAAVPAPAPGPVSGPLPAKRPATPQQTATPPEGASCPHCSRAEQLVVDLIYYRQILDILAEVERQREQIDDGLLRAAHAELAKIRPDLAALLKPHKTPATQKAPAPKKSEKPARKPVKPVPEPKAESRPAPRPEGIDGLVVGHVNGENRELGIKASVVLVSNGRPRSLNLNGVIEHNRRKFKIVKVDYVEDRRSGNRHQVHLQDQTSKRVYVAPWQ